MSSTAPIKVEPEPTPRGRNKEQTTCDATTDDCRPVAKHGMLVERIQLYPVLNETLSTDLEQKETATETINARPEPAHAHVSGDNANELIEGHQTNAADREKSWGLIALPQIEPGANELEKQRYTVATSEGALSGKLLQCVDLMRMSQE